MRHSVLAASPNRRVQAGRLSHLTSLSSFDRLALAPLMDFNTTVEAGNDDLYETNASSHPSSTSTSEEYSLVLLHVSASTLTGAASAKNLGTRSTPTHLTRLENKDSSRGLPSLRSLQNTTQTPRPRVESKYPLLEHTNSANSTHSPHTSCTHPQAKLWTCSLKAN